MKINIMSFKKLYFTVTFILIPFYLFYSPVKDYFKNLNKITYSLEIPQIRIQKDTENIYSHENIILDKDFLLEKKISEAWVLIFPNLNNGDLQTSFIKDLKNIGITSVIDLKSNNNNTILGVGPFVNKNMAETIASKVLKSTGQTGTIKRLSKQ